MEPYDINYFAKHYKGRGESILVVDNKEHRVELLREILEDLQYRVIVTSSNVDALVLFKKSPKQFDLFITHQTMPEKVANELMKEIRMINSACPIILCVAYSELENPPCIKELSVDQFFCKPYKLESLVESVSKLLHFSWLRVRFRNI